MSEIIRLDETGVLVFQSRTAGRIRVLDPFAFNDAVSRVEDRVDKDTTTWGQISEQVWAEVSSSEGVVDYCTDEPEPTVTDKTLILRHVTEWCSNLGKDGTATPTSTPERAS